jgi:small subunit ribosomal protein S1
MAFEDIRNDMEEPMEEVREEVIEEEFPEEEIEISPEEYEETMRHVEEKEIVKGKVIQILGDEVIVDIGYKAEGVIPISEFERPGFPLDVKVGDEIEVLVEKKDTPEGFIVVSKRKADNIRRWERITESYEKGIPIDAYCLRRVKGGLEVDVEGVRAFLPASQVEMRVPKDLESYIGQKLKVVVIRFNKRRSNVVVSRKVLVEKELERKRQELFATLKEGEVRRGVVRSIVSFGAFVDIGGVEGLLHITDMSWARVNHPSEILSVGDEIDVVVRSFDPEAQRISLSRKELLPDPWEDIEEKYPVGTVVKGKVVNITDYGAFVELEPGVEGLIHSSEMTWSRRVKHPSKYVSIGQEIEVKVLRIDKDNRRIGLSLKRVKPDPWDTVKERYPVGSKVEGIVRNIVDYGAFIELEEGIDGLLHISEMSWTKKISHPREVLKKGSRIEAVVKDVDEENRRISLSIKEFLPNPWDTVEEKYPVGKVVTGKVTSVANFGVFVELEEGIEGLIHVSQLQSGGAGLPISKISPGMEITAKVISVSKEERRIRLSVKKYLEDMEREEYERYLREQKEKGQDDR